MDRRERIFGEVKVLAPLELTIKEVGRIDQWLAEMTGQSPAQVVVNMHEVRQIDSDGLRILLNGLKRARRFGGDLHLCEIQHPVRLVLELTRLHQVFKIFPTEQDAVNAFSGVKAQTEQDSLITNKLWKDKGRQSL